MFQTEKWLNHHLQNRHSDLVPVHATVCPSDWCDVLGCDCSTRCDDARLHESIVPRCNALMRQCAPNTASYELLSTAYCGNLTCTALTEQCESRVVGAWTITLSVVAFLVLVLMCSTGSSWRDERGKQD